MYPFEEMFERLKEKYREHFSRPEIVRFWGQEYTVQPAVLDAELGDGNLVLYFTPLATRPWFYVIFVDSSWTVNDGKLKDHLDEIYDAIEDEFGAMCSEDLDDCKAEGDGESCGRHVEEDAWFPILSTDYGSSWGECVNLVNGGGVKKLQYLRRRTRRPVE